MIHILVFIGTTLASVMVKHENTNLKTGPREKNETSQLEKGCLFFEKIGQPFFGSLGSNFLVTKETNYIKGERITSTTKHEFAHRETYPNTICHKTLLTYGQETANS